MVQENQPGGELRGKKIYRSPQLCVYGDVKELTRAIRRREEP